jgi:hypothetical protein
MEHKKAIATLAAEKYVLDEFPPDQREEFEEHFFSCPECADDVRSLNLFRANAKVVLSEPASRLREYREQTWLQRMLQAISAGWSQPNYAWGTLAVILMVTTVTGGMRVVELNKQLQPQAITSFVLRPETRGDITAIAPQQLGPFVLLEADVPGAAGELSWEVEISGPARNVVFAGTAPAPPPGASFKLLLPSEKLGAGEYVLAISSPGAADSHEQNRRLYRFKIGES